MHLDNFFTQLVLHLANGFAGAALIPLMLLLKLNQQKKSTSPKKGRCRRRR